MPETEPLIIVGASTRAAAQAAVRSGFMPWCVDQFGDADLRECAGRVEVVSDWPDGILAALSEFPRAPLVYTGALENSPHLINELARNFPIAGNVAAAIRLVRDPYWIRDQLKRNGIPSLELRQCLEPADNSTRWLHKSVQSAAGFGIHEAAASSSALAGCTLQEHASGDSVSALYIATKTGIHLLGMTRQLQGEADAGASGFLHCGSIGPLTHSDASPECFEQAATIGTNLASSAGLIGVFGIDFILKPNLRTLWTLEVNPRWPASAEIFERAFGWPIMRWHVDTTEVSNGSTPGTYETLGQTFARASPSDSRKAVNEKWGRIVVYSPRSIRVAALPDIKTVLPETDLLMADIPVSGTTVETGQPVCTLLTRADSVESCREKLCDAARQFRETLLRD